MLSSLQITVAPATITVEESETANLIVGTSTDPTIKLQLRSAPRFASLTGNLITLTPQRSDSGKYQLIVAATNASGAVGYASAVVNVVDVKEPPTIAPVAPFSVRESETTTVVIEAEDPDDEPLNFGILAAPSFVSLDTSGPKPVLVFSPGYDDARSSDYGVVVRVTNVLRPTIRSELTITVAVLDTNRPPAFTSPLELVGMANDIFEGTDAGIVLRAVDPDGDPFVYLASASNESWVRLDLDSGYVTVRPAFNVCSVSTPQQTFVQTFTLRDSRGADSAAGTLSITVKDVNAPATFDPASLLELAVQENQTANRTLTAVDPDGDPVSFRADDAGFPPWASLAGNQLSVTPPFSVASRASPSVVLPVPVVAVDFGGLETRRSVLVRVNDKNQPPAVAALAPVTMKELETKTVFLGATDGDGDALTYTPIAPTPFPTDWVTLDSATGQVTLSPTTGKNTPGIDLQFSVTDGVDSVNVTLHVTVQINNTAPALSNPRQLRGGFPVDGGTVSISSPTLEATLFDAQADQVTLEAEVRLVGDGFDGGVTHRGNAGSSGTASIVLPSLPPGNYKWRARGIDAPGAFSGWAEFPQNDPAFIIQTQLLSGFGIRINGTSSGAFTTTPAVTVSLEINPSQGASSLTTVELSEDGVTWTPFSYASSFSHSLTGPDGLARLYVRAIDDLGNQSSWNAAITLDRAPPVITSFKINNAAVATKLEAVTLDYVVSDQTSPISLIEASNDGINFSTLSNSPAAWTLTSAEATKAVTLRVTDASGQQTTGTASIILDKTPPTLDSFVVNGGATYISSLDVTVGTTASDPGGSGVDKLCLQNSGSASGSCSTFASSAAWQLLSGADGQRIIAANVVDFAGNSSSQTFLTVTLDRVPPTMQSLSINAGQQFTNNPTVTLTETHADAIGVKDVSFSINGGSSWFAWEPVGAAHSVTLVGVDGPHTVTARARDFADQVSTTFATDDIQLDTGRPATGTLSFAQPFTRQATLTATVSSSDALSGVNQVCVSASSSLPLAADPCWVPYAATVSTTLQGADGLKTEYAWFKDQAGNVNSPPAQATVTLDTAAPVITAFTLNGDAPFVNVLSVGAVVTASDANGVVSLAYSTNGGGTWSGWQTYSAATTYAVPLPTGDTLKSVLIKVIDAAGNETVSESKTVTLDQTRPATGTLSFPGPYSKVPSVTATVSSSDATSGVVSVCVTTATSAPAGTDSCWVTYETPFTVPVALASPDGPRTLYAYFRDAASNLSSPAASALISLDLAAPSVTSYSVEADAPWVNDANLSVAIAGSDVTSGVPNVCLGEASPASACQPLTSPVSYTLTDTSQGQHILYAVVVDGAGNRSSETSRQVGFDDVAPVLTEVQLNGLAISKRTNNPNVVVTVTASDATSGIVQLQAQVDGGSFISAPYAAPTDSVTVALTSGQGTKMIRAKVVDAAGNPSAELTNTIVYDTAQPFASFNLGGYLKGATRYVSNAAVTATITSSSDTPAPAGQLQICPLFVNVAPSATDSCWVSLITSFPQTLQGGDGPKAVYLFLRDEAGNVRSPAPFSSVTLDTTPPTVPTGLAVIAGHRSLTANWAASTDAHIGVAGYKVTLYRNGVQVDQQTVVGSQTRTFTGLINAQAYGITVHAYDDLSNTSAECAAVSATPVDAWQFIGRQPTSADLYAVAMPTSNQFVAVGEAGNLWHTPDNGATFKRGDTGSAAALRFASVAGSQRDSFTGGANGTFGRLINGTFNPLPIPTTTTVNGFADLAYVVSSSGPLVFERTFFAYAGESAVGYGSVIAEQGSPLDYSTLSLTAGTLPASTGTTTLRQITGCNFDPTDATQPSTAVAVGKNVDGATTTGVIVRSADHGATFTSVALPVGYTSMALTTVLKGSEDLMPRLFAAGTSTGTGPARTAVLTSTDCGVSWTPVTGTPFDSINVSAAAATSDTGWKVWFAGRDVDPITGVEGAAGKLIVYNVSTSTASVVTGITQPLNGVAATDSTHVAVVGPNGYVAATDGTTTTEKSSGSTITWRAVSIVPDGLDTTSWFIGDEAKLAKGTTQSDGGVTLTDVPSGLSGVELGSVAASTTGFVYASEKITDGGWSGKLYVSVDGGAFAEMSPAPNGPIAEIKCRGSQCRAVGARTLATLNESSVFYDSSFTINQAELKSVAILGPGVVAVGRDLSGGPMDDGFYYSTVMGPGSTTGHVFQNGAFSCIEADPNSWTLLGGARGAVLVGTMMMQNWNWYSNFLPDPYSNTLVTQIANGGSGTWYLVLEDGTLIKATSNGAFTTVITPPVGANLLFGLATGQANLSTIYISGARGTAAMTLTGGE